MSLSAAQEGLHMPGAFPEEDALSTLVGELSNTDEQESNEASAEQIPSTSPAELGGGLETRDIAPPPQERWILNGWDYSAFNILQYFVTYIDTRGRWHRLNVTVKKPSQEQWECDTIDFAIYDAATRSPVEASLVIYDYIHVNLRRAMLKNTTRYLYLGTDSEGGVMIYFAEDVQEAAQMSRLMPEFDGLRHLPKTRNLRHAEHLRGYSYRVRRDHRSYLFHQMPDVCLVESFLHDFRVLYRTSSCPYMNNLAWIVYDEQWQYIRGFIMDDTRQFRSLHNALRHYDGNESRIPWSTRLRWAEQIVTALVTLHVSHFAHGDLTLKSIFLVPPEAVDNTQALLTIPERGNASIPTAPQSTVSTTSSPAGSATNHPSSASSVRANPFVDHNILVSTATSYPLPVPTDPYAAPELIPYHNSGSPVRSYTTALSDMYAMGAILWALAAYEVDFPELLPHLETQLAEEIDGTMVGTEFCHAVRACRTTPKRRVAAGALLKMLKGDVVGDGEPDSAGWRTEEFRPREDVRHWSYKQV